ncbi:mechanosensitive ion channel family protein [Shewanella sp. OMA3-2]|uniref:mechanosensitive ion channel family protein n=1 Tax=Shewanella sp. OMA3-2 TaxID=2908650 RepID=UPI001F3E9159|nr:mechanosensitive ion channel domain-containing protein [Shewanella sp. OMA3-2]UJF21609.1 mechanosensitive ion channel family protein [Shewanella sp. OMA3-2]
MESTTDALKSLINIISFEKIALILLLCGLAWALLNLIKISLDKLTVKLPKYRLFWGRLYPFIRLFIWGSVITYTITGIISPHQSVVIAIIGSISIVIGLATQEPAKNMIAGFIIMLNPPYRVGDMVTLAGHYGEVTKLEWSVTWLRTFNDDTIMVPNAEVLKNAVSNANSGALDEMVVISFNLPLHADHKQAMALAKEATQCSPYTFLNKPIRIILGTDLSFGQYVQTITIKAYVMDVRLERKFVSDINVRVLDAFKNAHFYDDKQMFSSQVTL